MRVSPITLVIFIVLAVFCLGFTYISYSTKATELENLDKVNDELKKKNLGLQTQTKERDDLLAATGYNLAGLVTVTGSPDADNPVQKLDDIYRNRVAARDQIVKEIGLQISDVDAMGKSLFLQETIDNALEGQTPETLRDTLVGELIEGLRAAKKAQVEHDQVIARGQRTVSTLNNEIRQKEAEIRRTIIEWDAKIKAAWDARVAAREKLIEDRKLWKTEEIGLIQRDVLAQAVLEKVNAEKAVQDDKASPADGRILTYDWKTKRGTINLGTRDGIKTGYEFEVYHRHPGPDTADRRTYHGRVTCIEVKPEVSIIAVVKSPYDDDGQPVRAGDLVCSTLFETSPAKRFYIAGYFPRGSEYDRSGLAGLVRKYGGTVDDKLALQTDYVIIGLTSPPSENEGDLSEETKKAVAQAQADFKLARRYNATVLTIDRFLELITRK